MEFLKNLADAKTPDILRGLILSKVTLINQSFYNLNNIYRKKKLYLISKKA